MVFSFWAFDMAVIVGSDVEFDEWQTERRRDAALLRALSTPHKRQKDMKLGKGIAGARKGEPALNPIQVATALNGLLLSREALRIELQKIQASS
jgi:hypothetical protein